MLKIETAVKRDFNLILSQYFCRTTVGADFSDNAVVYTTQVNKGLLNQHIQERVEMTKTTGCC